MLKSNLIKKGGDGVSPVHNLRGPNQVVDYLPKVYGEFVARVGVDIDGLGGDDVVARSEVLVAHTFEHIRHRDFLRSPEDHVRDRGESDGREPVVDAQQVGKPAQGTGVRLPVKHVSMVDVVKHAPQHVAHVFELRVGVHKLAHVVEHRVVTKGVDARLDRHGGEHFEPLGHRSEHPHWENSEFFQRERFHG